MIVRDGYSYILTALLLAVLFAFTIHPYAAVVPLVFAVYFAYFFRNPERTIVQDDSVLVSPADGTVMEIIPLESDDFVTGPCNKIVIFMSVFDVHVNRSPMTGKVMVQQYICGRFKPAYKDSVGFINERHMIGIENEKVRISVIQVAGILARRIVSWVTLDDELEKGERYGMIKFGSCLEIVVPQNVEVTVKPGQKTRAGETVIGRIN
ncbi:phosphatidylserine decarboxylase family protein [Schwartzia sp. (in: firmicutes)]